MKISLQVYCVFFVFLIVIGERASDTGSDAFALRSLAEVLRGSATTTN